jgi:hypothetical protein
VSKRVVITREPDDPLALRASIGGTPQLGYYLTFRGDPEKVVAMLRNVMVCAERELRKPQYRRPRGPQG